MPVPAAGTGRRAPLHSAPFPPVELVVLGAHLSGQPLNPELLAYGATLVGAAQTAPTYRLWALDTVPPKPGLLRVATGGATLAGERWRMTAAAFGVFVANLPAPLTIGSVELADGSRRPGFLVEPAATTGALDITAYGGWRQYLAGAT
jgi:allophanate hydrolase